MGTISNSSYASRLGNAVKLHTLLISYTNYVPPIEQASTTALNSSIEAIHTIQDQYTSAKTIYSIKTDERRLLFTDSEDSMIKRLSPLRSFVEALKGKTSPEFKQMDICIKKIRGTNTSRSKTTEGDEIKSISTIESTYASRLSDFKSIIVILKTLGETYNPPNPLISLEALESLVASANETTLAVETSLATLNPLINSRQEAFKNLHEQTQNIKKFVKSQYGVTSKEYDQIKGLNI